MNINTPANDKFYNIISMMMYGFGDSHEPNPETVHLVASIVRKQLRAIVNEALKYWDGNQLKAENLVFLLRHNKYKMQRFVKYLQNKALCKSLKQRNPNVIYLYKEPKDPLIEFIEKIDETGEFMDTLEVDEVKLERMRRADNIAKNLQERKYMEFQKSRCVSFKGVGCNGDHLKNWIDPGNQINFHPRALDVLSYFAYQTVAEIVDLALLVREDSKTGSDPVKHLPGSYYTATMFMGRHRFEEKRPDYTRVHSGQPSISVNEIKEVMRRVHSPQAGKLNFGGKLPETHYLLAL